MDSKRWPGRLAAAFVSLILGSGLAACADGEAGTEAAPAAASASASGSAAAFPVSIAHEYGTAEITAEPKRVIALGYQEQDALLALGSRRLRPGTGTAIRPT